MLIQEVINIARLDLNDEDKTRYADAQLLRHVQSFIEQAKFSRSDLFFGLFQTAILSYALKLTDKFPMKERYVRSCADYVIGRAMMNNTEENAIAIANNYLALAAKEAGL